MDSLSWEIQPYPKGMQGLGTQGPRDWGNLYPGEIVSGSFPKELTLIDNLELSKQTEMRREEGQAKTQRGRVQAVEEVPGDPVWLAWRVRWHGMCGGQGIHMKGLKCQAESFFSCLKGKAFLELTLAKTAPHGKQSAPGSLEGGWPWKRMCI